MHFYALIFSKHHEFRFHLLICSSPVLSIGMRPLALKGHERAITRVRLNREGDILFSSSKGTAICAWYTENGERIGTYEGHTGVIWDIDISWDTQTMVSASGDQKVMIWDVEKGVAKGFTDPGSVVRSIGLSYSGNLAVFTLNKPTTGGLPSIVVADLRDNMSQPILRDTFDDQCNTCLFSHLDDRIVAGDHTGQLAMWDLRQPGTTSNFTHPHKYQINDLQITADQTFIITSSKDKTAQLHSANDLQQLKTYKSNRPVNTASVSPSRDHIVLGGGEEHMEVTQTATTAEQFVARLYHLIFEEEFARFRGHFGPINSIVFDPTGDIVVSGGEDGYVRVQELDQPYKDFQFDIS